jgi:hypothetical protein
MIIIGTAKIRLLTALYSATKLRSCLAGRSLQASARIRLSTGATRRTTLSHRPQRLSKVLFMVLAGIILERMRALFRTLLNGM